MSQRTLALAVRDRIRAALGLTQDAVEVMLDGMPPPWCGEQFIAVHPGEWFGQSDDDDLDERVGISVTVTRRSPYAPQDEQGVEVWSRAQDGLDVTLRKVVAAVHKSYAVMNAANALLPTSTTAGVGPDGYVEPLLFLGGGRPEPKGPEWFSAEGYDGPGRTANAGVAQTLTFGGARRVQTRAGQA